MVVWNLQWYLKVYLIKLYKVKYFLIANKTYNNKKVLNGINKYSFTKNKVPIFKSFKNKSLIKNLALSLNKTWHFYRSNKNKCFIKTFESSLSQCLLVKFVIFVKYYKSLYC